MENTHFRKAMAQIMKGRMAFHDVKQAQMAQAIGISQSQLSKILRAERPIDLDTFEAFCTYLNDDPTTLIREGETIAQREKHDALADFSAEQDYADAASVSARLKGNARPEDVGLTAKRGDAQAEADGFEELP